MDVIEVLPERCPKCTCCALVTVVCADCDGEPWMLVGCPDCEYSQDPDCETCDGDGEINQPCEYCNGTGHIKVCDGGCVKGKHRRPIFGQPVRMVRDCEYAWETTA